MDGQDVSVRLEQLRERVRWSANWFFLIAGLGLLQSVLDLTGVRTSTMFGLGLNRAVDTYAIALATELDYPFFSVLSIMAFFFDCFIAVFFGVMGYVARQEFRMAFVLGIFFYFVDFIILYGFGDLAGMIFHAIALLILGRGLSSCKELEILEAWWERTTTQ